MTLEQAAALREAFGDCSMHYECKTADEIMQGSLRQGTNRQYIDLCLSVEEAYWEREHCGDRSDKEIEEHQAFMAEMKQRVTALPFYQNASNPHLNWTNAGSQRSRPADPHSGAERLGGSTPVSDT